MPNLSLKARMVNFLIRNQHIFRGKLRKEKFTMETSIQEFRDRCEKGASRYAKIPEGVEIKPYILAGLKAEKIIPEGAPTNKIILYIHGGGYVSGSCNDHRAFVARFASNTGYTCQTYEYGLAPENPYPAAVEDSVKAYQALLQEGYNPENILLAGESAGGGLTLSLLLALRDRQIPLPVAAVAISPWTDLSCSSDSYRTKNRVSPAPLNSWYVFSKLYAGTHPLDLPYISPLFGNLEGLPPLYIVSGEADELYEDGEKFARKASDSGVEVAFKGGPGMLHCYPLLAPMFSEASQAMEELVAFIRKKLQ